MAQIQQGGLLDVLKKKMRQTKEEMEKYKDDCEELQKKLHLEVMRREEVRQRLFRFRNGLSGICCTKSSSRAGFSPEREQVDFCSVVPSILACLTIRLTYRHFLVFG